VEGLHASPDEHRELVRRAAARPGHQVRLNGARFKAYAKGDRLGTIGAVQDVDREDSAHGRRPAVGVRAW
jgi:hypothetical protein